MNRADTKYKTGWPNKRGLYQCIVDGKKIVLFHHYCGDTRRHWWTDTAGYDVIGTVEVIAPVATRE